MDKKYTVVFLFTIAKEIKRSYENPIILLTMKDYADSIFNSLVEMRNALLNNASRDQIAEIVNIIHLGWLQAVQDIENFKKRAKDTPREIVLKAIDYTMDCVDKRHKYFQRYIDHAKTKMTMEERMLMQADIEIIGDMREIVNYALIEKQKCLRNQADKGDFYVIVMNEIEELMIWLDRLNDHLAIQLSKIIELKIPLHPSDLVKTLQEMIDEITICQSPDNQEAELCTKGKKPVLVYEGNPIRCIDISTVVEKIKALEDRINLLKMEDSTAMALEHKSLYLEDRLQSLQNLKLSLNCLKIRTCTAVHEDGTVDEDEMHIFNHFLPHPERCRLVERFVKLWNTAIGSDLQSKSIISILSATDIKEVFSDDLGHFSVDKYGRKIYTLDKDERLYQLNEQNELVPINDEKHVYYYDECGRYYLNDLRERVYKAHETASEYRFHRAGFMLKVNEFVDGVEYRYDNLGRYYINEKGVRIYKDNDSEDEYKHDGLGNLVRIREFIPTVKVCPREPLVTEESKYLKATVGVALRKCIADVVLAQPLDPIKDLADRLQKYRENVDIRQNRLRNREELMAEREFLKEVEPEQTLFDYEPEQETVTDVNFIEYETYDF